MEHKTNSIPRFNKAAATYARYSELQDWLFSILLQKAKMYLETHPAAAIGLDLGCGPGHHTYQLANQYPGLTWTGIDCSLPMIQHARSGFKAPNLSFVCNDISQFQWPSSADLILSNAALHWIEDLHELMETLSGVLSTKGKGLFSVFGPNTFWELKECIHYYYPDQHFISDTFLTSKNCLALAKDCFKSVQLTQLKSTAIFPHVKALLFYIKGLGVGGGGLTARGLWTPSFMEELNQKFMDHFGNVMATSEIYIVEVSHG